MVNFTLPLWESWIGSKRWIWFRSYTSAIYIALFALMWFVRLQGIGFVSVVVGMIVVEPLVDIVLFGYLGVALSRGVKYIMIALFDTARLATVAFLATAIFYVPECGDYTTIWCGSRFQAMQLSLVGVFVALHIFMVVMSWRRTAMAVAPAPSGAVPEVVSAV